MFFKQHWEDQTMAEPRDPDENDTAEYPVAEIEAAKKVNDPGEAHRKGYSADPPGTKPSQKPAIPLRPDVPTPQRH
jgi:hypothetical protein